jgi:pimeloyl-ACP methyl ester carboxylesterase
MSVSSDKFTFFCLFFATCLGELRAGAESNTASSHRVEVGDGVSLRVIEAGKPGDVPALVFIPGWSTGGDIWRHQIDRFAKTHRVINQPDCFDELLESFVADVATNHN